MIINYIKTSIRSIIRNKLFSIINIIGLSVSMSVGLLIIAFVSDLKSYDDFHEKKDRIFRINSTYQFLAGNPLDLSSNSIKAGKKIKEIIPGIEQVTLIRNNFSGDAQTDEKTIPVTGLWADNSFLKIFTFPLLQGDPSSALKEPYSVVLTEKVAIKLFGSSDALGKTIGFDTTTYVVTGVMKNIPKLSHMQFEVLVSFSTAEIIIPKTDPDFLSWNNVWWNYIYILLPENADVKNLQNNLNQLSLAENKTIENTTITLYLQPLKKIALGNQLQNPIGPTITPLIIYILGGLAIVIVLSACFNYTNLSIARSLRRAREVGIRKINGALKRHVFGQFIFESIIISLIALIFSLFIFLFLRVQFVALDSYIKELASLDISASLIIYFIIMTISVGIVAGFFPALFFSRFNAIQVLKDASTLKVFRHLTLRKVLIVFQYTLSLIFITTTTIGYKQYKSFISFDLGFKTENILNIRLQGNKGDLLIKELMEIPEVNEISKSLLVTSVGYMQNAYVKYEKSDDSARVYLNMVDEHYLPMHKHKFLSGENFKVHPEKGEESEVIVNEQVLSRFNIAQKSPEKALGEVIMVERQKLTIVGVLKDFHYGTMEKKIQPVLFRYSSNEPTGFLNLKIISPDLLATMTAIDAAWKKIDSVHPLNAAFYDDQIKIAYNQVSSMVKAIGFIAFLAICIASMGILGMVVFTTETKLKEISIRKILGANEGSIVYLLSKDFLILLAFSTIFALPATYFLFDAVILINFAYHQPIGWLELLTGTLLVGFIAFSIISSQALKASRTNPAKVLKLE